MLFLNRADAGRHLAQRLRHLRGTDVAMLGLPRGGVPVAFEVAEELRAPLDLIVVRKLGVPFQPEYGFGAIGEGGVRVIDEHVTRQTGLTGQEIAAVEARERAELDRRVRQLRGDRPPVPLAGRAVIVVDDGIATGSTARAACWVARMRGASRVVLAVPVGSVEGVASLRRDADEVICLHTPARFCAIGEWYDDFSQVPDEDVTALLGEAATSSRSSCPEVDPAEIAVDACGVRLPGSLVISDRAEGLIVFAHGSGRTGSGAHPAYCGRRGRGSPRPQPAGTEPADLRKSACHCSRRDSPVRGTGSARAGGRPRARLVQRPLRKAE